MMGFGIPEHLRLEGRASLIGPLDEHESPLPDESVMEIVDAYDPEVCLWPYAAPCGRHPWLGGGK